MGRLRWRYAAVVLLAVYAFGFVFRDLLSPGVAYVLGAALLFVVLGLWLRSRGPPSRPEFREPSAPPAT